MTNPDQTADKYAELRERATNNAHYLITNETGLIIRDLLAAVQDERESRLKAEAALAETQVELDRSREALSETQGVVERYAYTLADGTIRYAGDTVYWWCDEHKLDGVRGWVLGLHDTKHLIARHYFSTREAALAARNSSGDSQGEGE